MTVDVGILAAPTVRYSLSGPFGETKEGGVRVFTPQREDCWFELDDVTIGVGFHWERREPQRFRGQLRLVPDGAGKTVAVNRIDVEEYLKSVISSEMSAQAPLEFLKAHAILSRSWLLNILLNPHQAGVDQDFTATQTEIVKWYDRDDHTLFDVCADDHCQRYQGIGRISNAAAEQAVEATRGEVLMYDGKVCDARFSKCCGGRTEEYETCWDHRHVEYLESVECPFCGRADKEVLQKAMNDYDRETADYLQWAIELPNSEVSRLICEKSGRDLGQILALRPLVRGKSGRISLLEISGTKGSLTVGKELEIRRLLSPTHLKSSDFTAERLPDGWFRLRGRGWGHGVGLCQIGAAEMASEGFTATQILKHYFPKAYIDRR